MSKIGRMPITVKEGVTVKTEGESITVTGPKGTRTWSLPKAMSVQVQDSTIIVIQKETVAEKKPIFGLTRATIANMVKGVSEGFEKKLELSGVGYRAQTSGSDLTLSVGFSHPVIVKAPQGIQFSVVENVITVSGADEIVVGDIAAKIRAIRPPEPYKGKGIKYVGERIRRKAGKAAKAVGTK